MDKGLGVDDLGQALLAANDRGVIAMAGGQTLKAEADFAKALHVSPFMPMDLHYGWHSTPPGPHLAVHLDVLKGQSRLLDATLSLRRRPLDGRSMAGVLARFPLMTLKVVAAIHWEALRLLLKRIPLFAHPPASTQPMER